MKKYIFIFFLFFVACANSKSVYWCGDHACVNKEEKRLYFKKHMVVEVKQIGEKKVKKKEYYEKIFEQAKINKKQSIRKLLDGESYAASRKPCDRRSYS